MNYSSAVVESTAIVAPFSTWASRSSYAELERLSGHFGAYLQQVLKLPPGLAGRADDVNVLQYPIAMFGALRAG